MSSETQSYNDLSNFAKQHNYRNVILLQLIY